MRPIIPAALASLAAVIVCRPDLALGWWDTGHQIVAKVATAPFQTSLWNLRAVWDGGLIDHSKRSWKAYVTALEAWIATQNAAAIESGTYIAWANETHAQAVNHAYKTAGGSADFPATGGQVDRAYYDANIDVVDQQLAKAGVRLAKVLNDAFP